MTEAEFVRPELHDRLVPVESLTPWPGNPRRGDLDLIEASLRRHGQYRPALYQKSSNRIIIGNNMYRVMVERLGVTRIAAEPRTLGDAEAGKVAAIDNRSSDLAWYDDEQLAAILRVRGIEGAERLGWTPDDYDDVMARVKEVNTTAPQPFAGDFAETPQEREERITQRQGAASREPFRQVILVMRAGEQEEFSRHCDVLGKRWDTGGITATISQALDFVLEAPE